MQILHCRRQITHPAGSVSCLPFNSQKNPAYGSFTWVLSAFKLTKESSMWIVYVSAVCLLTHRKSSIWMPMSNWLISPWIKVQARVSWIRVSWMRVRATCVYMLYKRTYTAVRIYTADSRIMQICMCNVEGTHWDWSFWKVNKVILTTDLLKLILEIASTVYQCRDFAKSTPVYSVAVIDPHALASLCITQLSISKYGWDMLCSKGSRSMPQHWISLQWYVCLQCNNKQKSPESRARLFLLASFVVIYY